MTGLKKTDICWDRSFESHQDCWSLVLGCIAQNYIRYMDAPRLDVGKNLDSSIVNVMMPAR